MSAAGQIVDESTTPTLITAEDLFDELARCVVVHYIRRKEYWDRYDCFSHHLLLQMQAKGLKTLDVGDYTIKIRPGIPRGFSPSQRRQARRWNYGAILNPNQLPPRISVEKKRVVE